MWRKTVTLQSPYNFDQVLERLALDPLNCVDIKGRKIQVPLIINKKPIVITVQGIGTFIEPAFELSSTHIHNEEAIVYRLSHIFGWNREMEEIQQHFLNTSLQPLFERFAYTPLVLEFDYFACLVRCIIHQQLNLKFATTLTERFVKTYGSEHEGVPFYPTPERVAQIPVEELRTLQFSQRKAEYTIGLAQHITEGHLCLEELQDASDEEITKQLLPLRGIGPWTVQNFLLFGLGRKDMFPKADIGIQRAIQNLFGLETKPDDSYLEKLKQEYKPYNSYASLYLWRSIE
ncbi:DNA-3-methyladenine glycosylase family protein [Microbacteriaceae bacterium 4G12]